MVRRKETLRGSSVSVWHWSGLSDGVIGSIPLKVGGGFI